MEYNWLKDSGTFSKPMISRKMVTKILCRDFETSFLEYEKMTSRKIFRHMLHAIFFMFILAIWIHEKILDSEWLRAVQFKCNA